MQSIMAMHPLQLFGVSFTAAVSICLEGVATALINFELVEDQFQVVQVVLLKYSLYYQPSV